MTITSPLITSSLTTSPLIISPSILSANFLKLGQELKALEEGGADMLHVDVMDGHYVPNLTFGPGIISTIKQNTNLLLDVHLMIQNPEQYIAVYAQAGASLITIHPETTKHLDRALSEIRKHGCKCGVALLPDMQPELLEYVIDKIDLILVMSVNPGFGGQSFIKNQLEKIAKIKKMINFREILLAVDGGINQETAADCVKNGANMLIAGSYIFAGDYAERISSLKNNH